MSGNISHHHKHHHHEDYASRFKRQSLSSISFRRKVEKYLKLTLVVMAFLMMILVVCAYMID